MRSLAVACGFFGAWSVAAGSVYQAMIELQAAENASDRIRELVTTLPAPPPVSVWWWLLPPVAYELHRRRRRVHRDLVVHAMSDEEFETQIRFVHKAMGWLLVGGGALLLGVNQTEALVEHQQWSDVAFWALVALMTIAVVGNAAYRLVAGEREMARHRASHDD